MLPYVKINFANGALGSVAPSADCVAGLVVSAVAVASKFELGHPYIVRSLQAVVELGITEDGDNAFAYKHCKAFFDEAGEGAEMWLYGVSDEIAPSVAVSTAQNYAKDLIMQANGRLRFLAVAYNPSSDDDDTISNGLYSDVMQAAANAQLLAEWATNSLYAPLFIVMEGRGVATDTIALMPDLTENAYNRVGILVGDTESGSEGAAVGLLLGKIAACPVQRHIGRVKDGALTPLSIFIADKDAALADAETLNAKGYITFRTFTGKSGYFFSDDCLATKVADDYRSIARRRTIDKAYRIAYDTMLENVNDEIPVSDSGKLVPAMTKAWETEMISAIVNQMTANGELGVDPSDSEDKGVKCFIDYDQNVLATNRIAVQLQVKPYGYAKYIEVELGFMTTKTED